MVSTRRKTASGLPATPAPKARNGVAKTTGRKRRAPEGRSRKVEQAPMDLEAMEVEEEEALATLENQNSQRSSIQQPKESKVTDTDSDDEQFQDQEDEEDDDNEDEEPVSTTRATQAKSHDSESDSEDENEEQKNLKEKLGKLQRAGFSLKKPKSDEMELDENKWDIEPTQEKKKDDSEPLLPCKLDAGTKSIGVHAIYRKEIDKVLSGQRVSAFTKDQQRARGRKEGTVRNWHDMVTPEMTPDLEKELKVLNLRNYMDPKRFYKGKERKALPKEFQVGTVVEGFGESRAYRLTRKERKPTMVEQVLADSGVQAYTKRIFREVQREKKNVLRLRNNNKKKNGKKGKSRK